MQRKSAEKMADIGMEMQDSQFEEKIDVEKMKVRRCRRCNRKQEFE